MPATRTAYLSLGANLGDREESLGRALELLDQEAGIRVQQVSSIYFTEPVGRKDQPWFANQAARLQVDSGRFSPRALLDKLLQVELELGRVRGERWGPRAIDLDLLLYGDEIVDEPELVVPHPRLSQRAFVLVPLLELDPGLVLPDGRSAADCLRRVDHETRNGRIIRQPE
jgi:2-amino-4-hydroxy-6-hydroxymethyldihydropteridine diphosphokinase